MDVDVRPLGAKGRARRDQILVVAGRLFGQRGFAAVSLRDIAAEAGITHPLLVHYFRRKEDLLFAVMDTWRERAQRYRLDSDDDLGGLPQRIVQHAEENVVVPGYIALFTGLAADGADPGHPVHDRFLNQYDLVHALMVRFFRYAQQHGRLRSGVDPEIAARTLIAVEDGAQLQWLYRPDEVDIPGLLRAYLRQVLIDGD